MLEMYDCGVRVTKKFLTKMVRIIQAKVLVAKGGLQMVSSDNYICSGCEKKFVNSNKSDFLLNPIHFVHSAWLRNRQYIF